MSLARTIFALFGVLLVVSAALILRPDVSIDQVEARHRDEHSHFVDLPDGTRLHYLEQGASDAPPLVLVHGSFDSAFTWERVMPKLADRFRVIAPDLPAHGLTGRTRRDRYTMQDMVAAMARPARTAFTRTCRTAS